MFLIPKAVEVVAEAEVAVLHFQDAVLPVVLIRDPEQFAVLLPRPETELDFGAERVRLERQSVLHVALGEITGKLEKSFVFYKHSQHCTSIKKFIHKYFCK